MKVKALQDGLLSLIRDLEGAFPEMVSEYDQDQRIHLYSAFRPAKDPKTMLEVYSSCQLRIEGPRVQQKLIDVMNSKVQEFFEDRQEQILELVALERALRNKTADDDEIPIVIATEDPQQSQQQQSQQPQTPPQPQAPSSPLPLPTVVQQSLFELVKEQPLQSATTQPQSEPQALADPQEEAKIAPLTITSPTEEPTQGNQGKESNVILVPTTKSNPKSTSSSAPITTSQNCSNQSIEEIKKKYARSHSPTPQEQRCDHCVCYSLDKQTDSGLIIQCRLCTHYFHISCLGLSFKDAYKMYVCPRCVLLRMDLFSQVTRVVLGPVPFQNLRMVNHKTFSFLSEKALVEIRCIRMDTRQASEEITWPDMGELFLNGKRIQEFRPLPQNSCLKKRKDDKVIAADLLPTVNVLQIKEAIPNVDQRNHYRISNGQLYFLAVYNIEQLTSRQLVDLTLKTPENYMSIEQAQDFIRLYLAQTKSEEVSIDSLTVSLQCSISLQPMVTPARGSLCQHVQCFSLENLCAMLEWMTPRKWRCPLCKQKIYQLQIDSYQLAILNTIRHHSLQLAEVTFDQNAQLMVPDFPPLRTEGLPPQALSNPFRQIQLETLCSKQVLVYKKDIPSHLIPPPPQGPLKKPNNKSSSSAQPPVPPPQPPPPQTSLPQHAKKQQTTEKVIQKAATVQKKQLSYHTSAPIVIE